VSNYISSLDGTREWTTKGPHTSVPNDYFNASAGTANIAFARYKAKKQPVRGSVMLNPGNFVLFSQFLRTYC
jgi:hypothetical protein